MTHSPTRILVVDDNEDAATMTCYLLDVLGYCTRAAFSAAEALDCADSFAPDVVFLDLSMPDMSGLTAAPLLRARCPQALHIVALSALGDASIREQTKRAGFNGHLLKPAKLEDLVTAVEHRDASAGASKLLRVLSGHGA
ncbi:MAG: response regulator [Pseudomonadota bacterium]